MRSLLTHAFTVGDIYQNDGIYGIIEASSEGMEEDASREQPADELRINAKSCGFSQEV